MRQIGRGMYVILIISNKYLRSENCMFELLQIFKNPDFDERIFPVVLDEVKIAKASDRLDLVRYWEKEASDLESKIRTMKELSHLKGVTEDLDLYAEIRSTIDKLTNILKDINTLSAEEHINSNFRELHKKLQAKINTDQTDTSHTTWKKRAVKPAAIFFAGLVFLMVIYGAINKGILFDGKKDNTTDLDRTSADSSLVVDKGSTEKIEDADIPERKLNRDTPLETYDVQLVVPSNMTQGVVLVDNQPAEIIERNMIFIKIRVKKKTSSHHFEIKNGSDICSTDRLVTQSDIQLSLCD
jgi:hypothetical protein